MHIADRDQSTVGVAQTNTTQKKIFFGWSKRR
jgi:hypothetical protein